MVNEMHKTEGFLAKKYPKNQFLLKKNRQIYRDK